MIDELLANQIESTFQFVKRNLRLRSTFTEVNTARKDRYELPLVSVREAICNAVFHRNYLEPANIYVALYDDRLEITSPGGLLRDITLDEVKAGYSKISNRGIAEALVYMHEVENWGGGVARYYARCAELGLPPPLVEERGGCFAVTFCRKAVVNDGVNDGVNCTGVESEMTKAVVQLLKQDPRMSAERIARVLRIGMRTVQRALKTLRDEGKLRRVGGTRGRWELLRETSTGTMG